MRPIGIVLAAGLSSRAKGYKMNYKLKDKSVIEITVDKLLQVCSKVIVVTGYKNEIIEGLLKGKSNVELIYNDSYEEGMYTSVIKGIDKVGKERVLLTPGDIPNVDLLTLEKIVNGQGAIRIPSHNRSCGHPVFIDFEFVDKQGLGDFEHLKAFINSHEITYVEVDDEGILEDIDTWQDYIDIKRSYEL